MKQKKSLCSCKDVPVSGAMTELCLGHVWLFESLEPPELEALVRAAVKKVYAPGQAIFVQADPADRMFLLKAGRVRLSKLLEDGTEFTLDIRKAGDFLGENMLSEEGDLSRVGVVHGGDPHLRLYQGAVRALGAGPSPHRPPGHEEPEQAYSSLSSRLESMSLTHLGDRLYQVLRTMALEHGVKSEDGLVIQFPLTHEDLAFLVGAHRVSVTRALKELKKAGSIVQHKRQLLVRSA